VLPLASFNAFGREKTFETNSMAFFPEVRTMPRAPGANGVAMAEIGSSGV
jgi:hypothetical protein